MLTLKSVHKVLFRTDAIAPYLYNDDHHIDGKFDGCTNSSDKDKKTLLKKGETSEPPPPKKSKA